MSLSRNAVTRPGEIPSHTGTFQLRVTDNLNVCTNWYTTSGSQYEPTSIMISVEKIKFHCATSLFAGMSL